MDAMKFMGRLISWITACISSPHYSILVNGYNDMCLVRGCTRASETTWCRANVCRWTSVEDDEWRTCHWTFDYVVFFFYNKCKLLLLLLALLTDRCGRFLFGLLCRVGGQGVSCSFSRSTWPLFPWTCSRRGLLLWCGLIPLINALCTPFLERVWINWKSKLKITTS